MQAVRGMVWIFYGITQFYTHPFTRKIECILEKKDIFCYSYSQNTRSKVHVHKMVCLHCIQHNSRDRVLVLHACNAAIHMACTLLDLSHA